MRYVHSRKKLCIILKSGSSLLTVSRDPQMALGLTSVKGEVNILRYAARALGPATLPYDESSEVTNDALDLVHSRIVWADAADPTAAKQLEAKLTSDLVLEFLAWSALKNAAGFKAPGGGKLAEVIKRCSKLAGVPFASSSSSSNENGSNNNNRQRTKSSSKGNNNGKKSRTTSHSASGKENSPPAEERSTKSASAANGKKNGGKTKSGAAGGKEKKLFDFFAQIGVEYENVEHPAVFTVEEMIPHLKGVKGAVTKNLFLKDKKKNLFLLSCLHDREVKLNELAKKVGAKELRFGDEAVMSELLDVTQGCVTAFALLNDSEGKVKFLADAALLDGSNERVFFHPLVNTATTGVSAGDFKKFLAAAKHEPTIVKF